MFNKLFQKFLLKKKISIFTTISLFVVVLLIAHVITAHAIGSSDTADVEAESGAVTGPVIVGSDTNASNGQYVMFNEAASPTVTPTLIPTSTPLPIQTPTLTPVPQLTLSNLIVSDTSNAKYYSFQTNIQAGNILYGDRTYTIKSLSAPLLGNQWIRTANNSKIWNNGAKLLSFTISQQATVYVVLDKRVKRPSWVDNTWAATNFTLVDNEGATITFAVYQKTFSQGTINLGPNSGTSSSDMYTVILK